MQTTGAESVLTERLLIALVAALLGFAARAAYDAWKERGVKARRDERILDALVRELSVMRGFIATSRRALIAELELIEASAGERWSIDPLTPLPVSAYDLVRADPPSALLEGRTLSQLALAAANAAHANAIQEARQAWKALPRNDTEVAKHFDWMLIKSLDNIEKYVNPVLQVAAAALRRADVDVLVSEPRERLDPPQS